MARSGSKEQPGLQAAPAGAPVSHTNGHGQPARAQRRGKGLSVARRVTQEGTTAQEVLDQVGWTRRPAKISGADGEVVFKMDDAEVPAEWSQLATDVAVSKYFRKAGVPGTPAGAEWSVRQLVRRVARTMRTAGEHQGG